MNLESVPENEAELEAFRRRWREEVQSRNRDPQAPSSPERQRPQQRGKSTAQPRPAASGSAPTKKVDEFDNEELAPKPYHDLPDKEEALKLGIEGQEHERAKLFQEPNSALEHYEKAVEKESHGQLGDSLKHYRKAFKLDDNVHEHYKKKHFPASTSAKPKPAPTPSSNTTAALPDHAKAASAQEAAPPAIPATLKQLVNDFSQLQIEPEPPETELSPQKPCPLAEIPEEILSHILLELAIGDVASFARMAQVCKRMAYLVLTEESIWKRVTLGNECGFAAMHYNYATNIEGRPLEEVEDAEPRCPVSYSDDDDLDENNATALPTDPTTRSLTHTLSLIPKPYPSWRQMFRSRPRLRFNGCYISTVNYNRPGAHSSNSLAWGAPVLTVTYFRYLRFFRDGTAISLLTTAEPVDVVHHLTKEKLDPKTRPTGLLPGAVMKDALKGRWRLSGPASNPAPVRAEDFELRGNEQSSTSSSLSSDPPFSSPSAIEAEGTVHIDTKGVVPRYSYRLELGLGHAGKSARNNKLSWKGFWSYNRLSDDWGEFALRNDKPFYWSRVRSYGEGWD